MPAIVPAPAEPLHAVQYGVRARSGFFVDPATAQAFPDSVLLDFDAGMAERRFGTVQRNQCWQRGGTVAVAKLIVGGFKSLRERTEIPIAPLTLMFGPNSSGKSAVLHASRYLRGWLEEGLRIDPDPGQEFVKVLAALASGPPSVFHRLPIRDVDDEQDVVSPTLGLELDPFQTQVGTTFPDGRYDEPAREAALDLYFGLEGSRVRLEMPSATRVDVDGKPLFKHVDRYSQAEEPEHLRLPALGRRIGERSSKLQLSLDHPLWRKSSEMEKAIRALRRSADIATPALKRHFFISDEVLTLRLAKDDVLHDGLWHALSDDAALTAENGIRRKLAGIGGALQTICEAVMFLLLQIKYVAHHELEMCHVSGDRRTLTNEDVSVFGENRRDLNSIRRYAAWLGKRCANEVLGEEDEGDEGPRDDFVNDVLRSKFFGLRRYQVKPKVTKVKTSGLLGRAREEETDDEWLDVSLFLEDADGRRLDFSDVGSGLSYLLPVLTALWHAPRSWIEQPELHLHPAAQCELGDMFIRACNRGRFSIVETHSEHLLLRVLRRVRATTGQATVDPELRCSPELVSVLYFEPLLDGDTKVHRMRVSRAGDFMDRWPAGFFEERDRELFDE